MTSPGLKLHGLLVLIIEDEYYQAEDAKVALEEAGAVVLGPCCDGAEALGLIDGKLPDCAVVDLNLGGGPSFVTARALLERGLRIVFVTGYEKAVLPEDLRHMPCLQKPTDGHKIAAAVVEVCGSNYGGRA